MLASLLRDRDEPATNTPHLSHSRVNRYLTCPKQYRLYYLEHLRPKVPPAALVFGQIMHQALAGLFQKNNDPVKWFGDSWGMLKTVRLAFNQRDSWDKLKASGEGLLTKFVRDEFPKLSAITAVERPFILAITSLDLPFIGIIDLVAEVSGKRTVVDWKTAGSTPDGYRQVPDRKVNEALVQGVETARAVLSTAPQGQAEDAQFVKWLMDHQKEAGVFTTVSGLVEQLSDNPAAKMTAQEIAQRVQQAQQQRTTGQATVAAGLRLGMRRWLACDGL